jgi:hypothetical protein
MWYGDGDLRDRKSLYQVGILLSSLQIYEITGDRSFFDRAFSCYEWLEARLLRSDGLYWADYGTSGHPIGHDRPDDINEAGSVVFLGGAMGMGVLHARLYRLTTNDIYRVRAVRTANGLATRLVSLAGVYVKHKEPLLEIGRGKSSRYQVFL